MRNYPYYAIEKIGEGKRHCYVIKKVVNDLLLIPASSGRYRTEEAAQEAAQTLGIKIEAVGGLYEII